MVLRLNKQAKEYCPSEAKPFSSLTSLNTFVNMEEINVKMLFEFLWSRLTENLAEQKCVFVLVHFTKKDRNSEVFEERNLAGK